MKDAIAEAVRPCLNNLPGLLENVVKRNSRLVIGARVLLEIQSRGGNDQLIEFTRWAVHPTSGFLPQNHEINPLPEKIKNLLEDLIPELNSSEYVECMNRNASRLSENFVRSLESSRAPTTNQFLKAPVKISYPQYNKYDINRLTDLAVKALEALLTEKAQGAQR